MQLTITLVIIIITALVSIGAFSNQRMMDDMIFYPPAVHNRNQFYRFITHGFIHADYIHLIFNMYALWSFGSGLERVFSFECVFAKNGSLLYLLLYMSALFMASFPDYLRYKDSYHFRSLGASGAVSAVVFSMIMFFPQSSIGILFIPIEIPGWIFGLIYLGVSVYLDKKGGGNINHSAHFWGAAYGIVLTILYCLFFAKSFDVFENFMTQIKSTSDDLVLLCQ
ncbi:MAG TPA: rhomboid family intramembrane serine protease [Flavisolibacter sp.]|nr:rhomboid family intramembrane serine protease [Flavisolibacter sp.]